MSVAITQKLLVSAGGWPAMKQAQQLHAAGRASDATYDPPLLAGLVREGNRNLRSGLRIKSESDVENICTCRESRETGRICQHSLAVGLAFLAGETKPAAKAIEAVAPKQCGPRFVENGAQPGTPIALHLILPPMLEAAWAKAQVMLVIEVELNGRRAMPTTLSPNETYTCDSADLVAIDALGELAPMRMLLRADFLRLLFALRGHPRVTFGKSVGAEISSDVFRPRLHLSRRGDAVVAQWKTNRDQHLLMAGDEAWLLSGNKLRPLAAGIPDELRAAEQEIIFRGERAQRFFTSDLPRLGEWFEVETANDWVVPEVRWLKPRIRLQLEGSLRELRAELRAEYSEEQRTSDAIVLHDPQTEKDAQAKLESLGFHERGGRWSLNDENSIVRFLAFEVPRLKRDWDVQLSAQTAKASGELEPLAPRLEVIGSSENWFELNYSLGTADGQMFPAAELQRLLRSSQNKTRLRNGRIGVFDGEAITDFEEVLRDCEPKQNQPGVYRINRAHAEYVVATAEEIGAKLRGLTSASHAAPLELGELQPRLRDYQLQGVQWLARLAQNQLGGILADEMGLGKTVQMLAFLAATRSTEPALIVCPTSLIANWRNEAQRWTPHLPLLVLEGAERHERFAAIGEHQLVLTSYALLQRDAEQYKPRQFSTVVLDEAQHIKNPDTQNAQAAFALRARHRFVLTGTPIENSVRDLWSLMNFVQPGYLGSRADFRERYEQPLTRGEAPEVQRRLARRMRPFLLRRKKSDVAKELPEKIEQQLICDLTPPQRAAYDGLLREIQGGLTSHRGNDGAKRMQMLVGLLRLRQVCCDLRLVSDKAGSAKLELLDELLEEAIDGGHRVLLFSQFVSMLALIRERLEAEKISFAYLDGQTKERQAVVDRFQNDTAIPVFLMSLKAGGVGLNLAAADTVIHFDPWWNYAAEAQATDRAHRIGQTRVVTAYKLIARDTVEEKIVKLQARKRSASEALVGSEEPLMSGLTSEDLAELLS